MKSNKNVTINFTSIRNFYRVVKFRNFNTLDIERKEIIDSTLPSWIEYFNERSTGYLTRMTLAAERLTTSPKTYGLLNGDEQAYFFIKIVDPDFLMLEVFEVARTQDEIKDLCIKNFGFYDRVMIHLEQKCNSKFKMYEDLWTLERIKK